MSGPRLWPLASTVRDLRALGGEKEDQCKRTKITPNVMLAAQSRRGKREGKGRQCRYDLSASTCIRRTGRRYPARYVTGPGTDARDRPRIRTAGPRMGSHTRTRVPLWCSQSGTWITTPEIVMTQIFDPGARNVIIRMTCPLVQKTVNWSRSECLKKWDNSEYVFDRVP